MSKTRSQIEYEKRMLKKAKKININIDDISICYYCKNNLNEDDLKCTQCGFPQKGSKIQMHDFLLIKKKEKETKKHTDERMGKTLMLPFIYFGLLILCCLISFPFLIKGGNSSALGAVIIIFVPIFSARTIRNIIFDKWFKKK